MQLLAKFKKILYMGFRATLNFRNFKVALNPMYRIFLIFAKMLIVYAHAGLLVLRFYLMLGASL